MRKINKRGNILVENLVFIILNIMFLVILTIFLVSKINDASVLEERYAKQIALIADSARPGMKINLNMENVIGKAERNGIAADDMVTITGNEVFVKLRSDGGYKYSFFNNIQVSKPFVNKESNELVLFFEEKVE